MQGTDHLCFVPHMFLCNLCSVPESQILVEDAQRRCLAVSS